MPKRNGAFSRVVRTPSRRPRRVAVKCIICSRPMRSAHLRIADWPGTVRAHGRGKCQPCARKEPSKKPKVIRGGELSRDTGALGYRPIAGATPEQLRLIHRQVNRLVAGEAEAEVLIAMLLGPMRPSVSPTPVGLGECDEDDVDALWIEE